MMFSQQYQRWILELWSKNHQPGGGWDTLAWTVAMVLYNEDKAAYFRLLDECTYSHMKGAGPLWRLDSLGPWLQDKDRLYYTLLHNPTSKDYLVLNLGSGYGLIIDMFYQFGYRRFIAIELDSAISAALEQFFIEDYYPGIKVTVLNTDGMDFISNGAPILEDFILEATWFAYSAPNDEDYVVKRMSFIKKKYDPYLKHIIINGYLDTDIQMLVARKKRSLLVKLAKKLLAK